MKFSGNREYQFKIYMILALVLMLSHSEHVKGLRNDFRRPALNASEEIYFTLLNHNKQKEPS